MKKYKTFYSNNNQLEISGFVYLTAIELKWKRNADHQCIISIILCLCAFMKMIQSKLPI